MGIQSGFTGSEMVHGFRVIRICGETIIWTKALPDFTTFDGGDSQTFALHRRCGRSVELRAKFPIGVGTLPVAPDGNGAPECR